MSDKGIIYIYVIDNNGTTEYRIKKHYPLRIIFNAHDSKYEKFHRYYKDDRRLSGIASAGQICDNSNKIIIKAVVANCLLQLSDQELVDKILQHDTSKFTSETTDLLETIVDQLLHR
jgi:hypothetical protein